MKEHVLKYHVLKYENLTLEDIETLSIYYDYICDGDKKEIIVIEKEK